MSTVTVDSIVLPPLFEKTDDEAMEGRRSLDIGIVEHVQVKLTAILGEAEMTVAELLALKSGTVLSLDQSLDEAIILQLNGKPVAAATMVAVGDCFGVQITQVL